LPGCFSQGKTFEKAVANIREAAELYLEDIGTREREARSKESRESIVVPVDVRI